ncbi:carbohydrate ABC transporter permease [Ruminococcaceae bacterium OttesenSCG-928-L11]|nr:carbohydrate ABC transporter permease [Ruminococcaceae bacterium OttesenSCG-928-L11]
MTAKLSFGEKVFEVLNRALLTAISIAMIYPFWHELCLSLSSGTQATRGGIFLLPREFTLSAYRQVMKNAFIWTSYANSIFCAAMTTLLGLLFTSMLAYGLSKKQVAGNRGLSFMVVFCMIFNGGLIPTYLVVYNLNLIDNLWALILMAMVTPYNTIIMKNFFSGMPAELEEAAFIDGAGPLRIFFTIILPLSKAVLATIGLWLAVASWNNFMGPLIYMNSRSNFTLPLYIRQVIDGQLLARTTGEGAQTAVESLVGATIIISVLPILCVYPFLQKYFVKGVMIGSVKG